MASLNIKGTSSNNSKYTDHATPLLKNLLWLPVEKRIECKILPITYKTLHGQSADYLKPLIEVYYPPQDQRYVHYSVLKKLKLTTMVAELFPLFGAS